MRYLILGDIHSNLEAFKAVLKEASDMDIDKVVCTGDLIGYGADPSKCVQLMMSQPLEIYVAGNHEAAIFQTGELNLNSLAAKGIEHTKENLSDDESNWIFSTAFWKKEFDNKCAVAHASYYYPNDFVYLKYNQDERMHCHRAMKEDDVDVLFIGHSHSPSIMPKDYRGYPVYSEVNFIDLNKMKPCIIDVGSVGQPRDGDPRSSFAVYDTEENSVIMNRVDYDIEKAANKIIEAGLPKRLATRLEKGE